nr:hypothetical protein [Methylorubrum populi]
MLDQRRERSALRRRCGAVFLPRMIDTGRLPPGVEVRSDQGRELPEDVRDVRTVQPGRLHTDGAERTEDRTVRRHDRERNVTAKPERPPSRSRPGSLASTDVIDDDGFTLLPCIPAGHRIGAKHIARPDAKACLVPDPAGQPTLFGHPDNRCEADAGGVADDVEHRRNRCDLSHGEEIRRMGRWCIQADRRDVHRAKASRPPRLAMRDVKRSLRKNAALRQRRAAIRAALV